MFYLVTIKKYPTKLNIKQKRQLSKVDDAGLIILVLPILVFRHVFKISHTRLSLFIELVCLQTVFKSIILSTSTYPTLSHLMLQ